MSLFGLNRGLAAVQVGHERDVPRARQAVGDAADLFVHAPPLLDDDDCRGTGGMRRLGQVTLNNFPIGALESDCACHWWIPVLECRVKDAEGEEGTQAGWPGQP